MKLFRLDVRLPTESIPRACRGVTMLSDVLVRSHRVFPAHAGVSLVLNLDLAANSCIPCICGVVLFEKCMKT